MTKILSGWGYLTEVVFPSPRLIPTNSFFCNLDYLKISIPHVACIYFAWCFWKKIQAKRRQKRKRGRFGINCIDCRIAHLCGSLSTGRLSVALLILFCAKLWQTKQKSHNNYIFLQKHLHIQKKYYFCTRFVRQYVFVRLNRTHN